LQLNKYGGINRWDLMMGLDQVVLKTILIVDLEKCIRLFAQNARKTAKCHSNLHQASRFYAKNVMQRKSQEDFNSV
jgi:hypothetical protein